MTPTLDPTTSHVLAPGTRETTFREALREAMSQEMRKDEAISGRAEAADDADWSD